MEIKAQDMFHTPEGWNELHDWINRHNADERAHLTTAALMAWNLAAKIQAMPDPDAKRETLDEMFNDGLNGSAD